MTIYGNLGILYADYLMSYSRILGLTQYEGQQFLRGQRSVRGCFGASAERLSSSAWPLLVRLVLCRIRLV